MWCERDERESGLKGQTKSAVPRWAVLNCLSGLGGLLRWLDHIGCNTVFLCRWPCFEPCLQVFLCADFGIFAVKFIRFGKMTFSEYFSEYI